MAMLTCPGCGLPRAESEAEKPCPVCTSEPALRPIEPAPDTPADAFARLPTDISQLADTNADRGRGHRPEFVTGILGILFGAGLVLAISPFFETPKPTAAAPEFPRSVTPASAATPATVQVVDAPTPVGAPVIADVPVVAAAPMPEEELPANLAPHPRIVQAPPLAIAPQPREINLPAIQPALVVTIDLNQPNGNFYLSKSDIFPGQTIILRGRVKRFKTYTQPGITIDASQLVAEEITLSGSVTGKSLVKLNAPRGQVTFNSSVVGQSRVEVMAPEGTVYFSSSGTCIAEGAKLIVTTNRLRCKGDISGDRTHLDVTFANGGSISAKSIIGPVRLEYRKTDPSDIHPILDIGSIDRKATIQRVD